MNSLINANQVYHTLLANYQFVFSKITVKINKNTPPTPSSIAIFLNLLNSVSSSYAYYSSSFFYQRGDTVFLKYVCTRQSGH